jgi:hypothetical protein
VEFQFLTGGGVHTEEQCLKAVKGSATEEKLVPGKVLL